LGIPEPKNTKSGGGFEGFGSSKLDQNEWEKGDLETDRDLPDI